MAITEWISYAERVVGRNHPTLDDTQNRPLRSIFTASNLDPDTDFPGFLVNYTGTGSPEGVVTANPRQTYFQSDGAASSKFWLKETGTATNTGWVLLGSGGGGGGPGTGTPDRVAKWATGTTLGDSILRDDGTRILVGATDPGGAETFRTIGGIVSEGVANDSTIFGQGALASSIGAIAIGRTATIATTGNTDVRASVVIGYNSSLTTPVAYTQDFQACVIVGPNNTISATSQATGYSIIIGAGNSLASTLGAVAWYNTIIGVNSVPGNAANGNIIIGSNFTGSSQLGQLISLGNNQSHAATTTYNIIIGEAAFITSGGGNAILIGRGANLPVGAASEAICIGYATRIDADYAIAFGSTARARQTGTIAIGRQTDTGNFTNVLVIGTGGLANANNQAIFGGPNTGGDYREFVLGNRGPSITNTIANVKWRMSNVDPAAGADTAAGHLTIQSGLGLGNSVGGDCVIQVGLVGVSGTTLQTAIDGLRVVGGLANPDVIVGRQALIATGDNAGFLYTPACAGVPSGTPIGYTGKAAMIIDTTNHFVYFYDGAWRQVGGGAGATIWDTADNMIANQAFGS